MLFRPLIICCDGCGTEKRFTPDTNGKEQRNKLRLEEGWDYLYVKEKGSHRDYCPDCKQNHSGTSSPTARLTSASSGMKDTDGKRDVKL